MSTFFHHSTLTSRKPHFVFQPFAKWRIEPIGLLPKARGQLKYAVVIIDYYTKLVESEMLAKISEQNMTNFICQFIIPHELVSNNGTRSNNAHLHEVYNDLGIKHIFSSPARLKSIGQVEAINKTINQTLKKKLDKSKGGWVDERPMVLWSYRTSH